MVEPQRGPASLAWLALGLVLGWLPAGLDAAWVGLGPLLAPPILMLGWAQWRDGGEPVASTQRLGVLLLWLLAFILFALVIAWPLEAVRDSGSLAAAMGLSASAGVVLLGVWRLWPAFAQAARRAQGFAALLAQASRDGRREPARGLEVALPVFVVLAAGLCLAWPALLPAAWRLPWGLAYPLLSLAAIAGIRRIAQRPLAIAIESLPIVDAPSATPAAAVNDDDEAAPDVRLYAAARSGRIDSARRALEQGADPHALPAAGDRDQRSLPMLASLHSDLRLLRDLIARGVDLNRAHGGLTPLLAATRDSWHGRPEAVMTLLANGADPRAADNDGNTPLHHAARSTDPAVAALLFDAGAQVDALNSEGFSALGIACAAGNWRLARFLIEHGAKPEPVGGQPALLAAVAGEDDPAGVQLLLRHKARVDARGEGQRTALMQACAVGNAEIIGVLLDAGADRNAADAEQITPLLDAARHGRTEALARLAGARPDPRAVDDTGANALVLACMAGAPPELLRQLMAIGVDPDQVDASNRRAIDVAIENGRWPQVAVLDPDYPLPASVAEGLAEGHFEKTPRELLRDALLAHRFESAEAMLRLGVGPAPDALASLLLEFASESDLAPFEWLGRHGASADRGIGGEDSVFFLLLDGGGRAQPALQRLLDRGQAVGGAGGLSRYLHACQAGEHIARGHEQLALALLERGADAFGARAGQDTPLILALRLGWQRLVDALLAMGVDPNQRDVKGHTAVQLAATLGREIAVRALIRRGALPQSRSPDGQTALGMALAAGRDSLSHWLEWRGWSLPGRALLPIDVPAAAMSGDVEAVKRLLELGLPVDAADGQGCSALLRAAGGGHLPIVQLLLERGADRETSARTGATPLSAAISMRHGDVVDALLRAGTDPDSPLPGGVTPLMLAAALGLPDIANRLLAQGAQPDARDEQGLSALHCAALHAFTTRDRGRILALFDLLLMAELDVDAANQAGQTPLLLLLGARAEAGAACDEDVVLAVMERLLSEGVSLDSQDHRGLSALHLAAMHGLPGVVQRLLREGASRQLRDALGRSAHDLALLRGYVDIAADFEPARGGSPSLARFLREPPSRTD